MSAGIKAAAKRKITVYDSALLTFHGVDGYDVYNCSVPFTYGGARYIFGRVERRAEWATSHVRLFKEVRKDTFAISSAKVLYELEDPYVSRIKNEMIMGGTRVRKTNGSVVSYYADFYRGSPARLTYFACGPDNMKDIRLVGLADGRIGVFSRPRTEHESSIGFIIINNLAELTPAKISAAADLRILEDGTWGGVNQAYLLSSGKIGCIAHYSHREDAGDNKQPLLVYLNYSFVLDPQTLATFDGKVIGTRGCYPPGEPKLPHLCKCAFTSGIVMRADGKCDLYSGLGDTCEGRITIDYPFEGYGAICCDLDFSGPTQSSL